MWVMSNVNLLERIALPNLHNFVSIYQCTNNLKHAFTTVFQKSGLGWPLLSHCLFIWSICTPWYSSIINELLLKWVFIFFSSSSIYDKLLQSWTRHLSRLFYQLIIHLARKLLHLLHQLWVFSKCFCCHLNTFNLNFNGFSRKVQRHLEK